MWRRRSGLLGLALSLALLVSLAVPVSAEPLPHAFHGTLMIGGSPAPIGTEVTAFVDTDDDGVVDVIGGSITTGTIGYYGDPDRLVVKGDFVTGALIEFYVNGAQANESADFRSGRVERLDLTVPGALYELTVASSTGGNVTDPAEGKHTYASGATVDLLAEPDPCYEFVNWTGEVGAIDDVDSADTFITMNGDYSIIANFAPVEYELTVVSVYGGNVTDPGEGKFTRSCGEVVDLLAEPDACYRFVNWTGEVDTIAEVNSASTNITMNGDYSIIANFDSIEYDLIVASSDGGNVTDPGEGKFTRDCGVTVDLLAEPDAGYMFVNWTGEVVAIDDVDSADTFVTMSGDYSITANFAEIGMVYDLTVASSAGGNVTDPAEGKHTYASGAKVDLLAEPDAGYAFVNWTGEVKESIPTPREPWLTCWQNQIPTTPSSTGLVTSAPSPIPIQRIPPSP